MANLPFGMTIQEGGAPMSELTRRVLQHLFHSKKVWKDGARNDDAVFKGSTHPTSPNPKGDGPHSHPMDNGENYDPENAKVPNHSVCEGEVGIAVHDKMKIKKAQEQHAKDLDVITDTIKAKTKQIKNAWESAKKKVGLKEDQLNELSKKTMGNYVKKASFDQTMSVVQGERAARDGNMALKDKFSKRADKRYQGINRAVDKLTKEEIQEATMMDKLLGRQRRELQDKVHVDAVATGGISKERDKVIGTRKNAVNGLKPSGYLTGKGKSCNEEIEEAMIPRKSINQSHDMSAKIRGQMSDMRNENPENTKTPRYNQLNRRMMTVDPDYKKDFKSKYLKGKE